MESIGRELLDEAVVVLKPESFPAKLFHRRVQSSPLHWDSLYTDELEPPTAVRIAGGMFPRVFGDEYGDKFGDEFGDKFSELPNLVIILVMNLVMNLVNCLV